MLSSLGNCLDRWYLLTCPFFSGYTFLLLMAFARYCRQRTIPLFVLYGRWDLKLRYCPVKVGFRYSDVLNPWSVRVINTSREDNLLSCSFSIVKCIDGWIDFTWSIYAWKSSWWSQRRNVSSTSQSYIDGFSDVELNVISMKYSMYILANIRDNWDPTARPSSCWYMSDSIPKYVVFTQRQHLHQIIYWHKSAFRQIRNEDKNILSPDLWRKSEEVRLSEDLGC